jgi:ribosomal protein S18 acetylase RimI-like enzyme
VNVRVAELKEEDLAAVVRLERETFGPSAWSQGDFRRYRCLVAHWDGSVAGFLVVREVFAGSDKSPAEREILNLAVGAPYRRRGIGRALLAHEMIGQEAIYFLEVRESNAGAQALYQAFGFREAASRPEYYDAPTEAALVLVRDPKQ